MSDRGEPFDPYYHWLGIPPSEQPPTHYRLLGIRPFEENRLVIQNAADRQMAHLRTFQSGPQSRPSQRLLNEVAAARVCLLSPEKKASYDAQLREDSSHSPTTTPTPPTPPAPPTPVEGPPPSSGASPSPPPPAKASREATTPDPTPQVVVGGRAFKKSKPPHRMLRRNSSGRHTAFKLLAAALVLLVAAIVVFSQLDSSDPAADSPSARQAARLVLQWPAGERRGAELLIDGRSIDLSQPAHMTPDSIHLELSPGAHHYRIERSDGAELAGKFTLKPRQRLELDVPLAPRDNAAALLLEWPAEARREGRLVIDGTALRLTDRHVKTSPDEVRVALSPGEHQIVVGSQNTDLLDRMISLRGNQTARVEVPRTASQLILHWNRSEHWASRDKLDVLIDGNKLSWQPTSDSARTTVRVPAGRRKLTVKRGGTTVYEGTVACRPGKPREVSLDERARQNRPCIVLEFPQLGDRELAELELTIDGESFELPERERTASDDGENHSEFSVEVPRGEHQLQLRHPERGFFAATVIVGEVPVRVPIEFAPAAAGRIAASQKQQLLAEFVRLYEQSEAYRKWNKETDAKHKEDRLEAFLESLVARASERPAGSIEQYVAYEELYRLAVEHDDFVMACSTLRQMYQRGCVGREVFLERSEQLSSLVLEQRDLEAVISFFRTRAEQRRLSPDEMLLLGRRIAETPATEDDFSSRVEQIARLRSSEVLSAEAAAIARAEVLVAALRAAPANVAERVDLIQRLAQQIAVLLDYKTAAAVEMADRVRSAVVEARRELLGSRTIPPAVRLPLQRARVALNEWEQQIEEAERLLEAQSAAASGEATSAEHKLVGWWLLEKQRYESAREHLRRSQDASLAALAETLPETVAGLLERANEIEDVSRRAKYSESRQEAIRAYAEHVRKLAKTVE